jgi:hypothetical protein
MECRNLASGSVWVSNLASDIKGLGVFGNRVLRRIFGPKRKEAMGDWRKLHNEELRNLHTPPSKIRVIKSRRIR